MFDPQPQHRLRVVDHEARVHLDGDLHAVVAGELGVARPVGDDLALPLPVEDLREVVGPRARHPVGVLGVIRVPRAPREVDHDLDAQLLGEADRVLGRLLVGGRHLLAGVERVAVAGERREAEPGVGELLLQRLPLGLGGEELLHVEVGRARVVARAELHHGDAAHVLDVVDRLVEGLVPEQGKEDSQFHFLAPFLFLLFLRGFQNSLIFTQLLRRHETATASSTAWVFTPSAKLGDGVLPVAMQLRKS